jgi:hypothetical protein
MDFENKLEAMGQHFNTLQEEITLAHRVKLHRNMSTQLEEQRYMRDTLSKIKVRTRVTIFPAPTGFLAIYARMAPELTQLCLGSHP